MIDAGLCTLDDLNTRYSMQDVWKLVGILKWKNERIRVARSKAAFEAAARGIEAKRGGTGKRTGRRSGSGRRR